MNLSWWLERAPTEYPDKTAILDASDASILVEHDSVAQVHLSGSVVIHTPVQAIPSAQDPKYYVDEDIILRRSGCPGCPGCHVQFSAEVTRAQEPVVAEMRLKV